MIIVSDTVILVENAQEPLQVIAGTPLQIGNLHDDAIVRQTLDKRIGNPFLDLVAVVIQIPATDVHHRLAQVAQLMPQDIDGDDGQTVTARVLIRGHILLIQVLNAQVLPETERFRSEPCLLQLDQHQLFLARRVVDTGGKIKAEQGNTCLLDVRVLVVTHFQVTHLLFQQGGKEHLGGTLVLHEELEHGVVNRIRDNYHSYFIFMVLYFIYTRRYERFMNSNL